MHSVAQSCPNEGRDLRWSGRKRHRIRHLEFRIPCCQPNGWTFARNFPTTVLETVGVSGSNPARPLLHLALHLLS